MKTTKYALAVVAVVLVGLTAPLTMHADTLIVGYPGIAGPPTCPCDFPIPAGLPPNQAVQFTLSSGFDISHIDVSLDAGAESLTTGSPATTFDFTLQDSLTNPTNIFFSGSAQLPAVSAGLNLTIVTDTMNVNSFIGAGTYYLVAAAEAGGSTVDGWVFSDGTEVSNGGTSPNIAFATDANGVWQSLPGDVTAYAVYGSVVPEPSSLLLLGTGLFGLMGMALLRKRLA